MDDLVRKRSAPRNDADRAPRVDRPRHDPDLAFPRRYDSRAVRPDEPRSALAEVRKDPHHVEDRHALGDADDELDAGVRRFADRIRRERRRHVDDARVGPRLGHRLGHRVEDGDAAVGLLPALAGRDPAHDLRPVSDHLARVERSVPARYSLYDHAGFLVDENAQVLLLI